MSKWTALILVGGAMMVSANFMATPIDRICSSVVGLLWFVIGLFGRDK